MKIIYSIVCLSFIGLLMLSCSEEKEKNKNPVPADFNSGVSSTNVPEIDKISRQLSGDSENPQLLYSRAEAYYNHQGYDQAIIDLTKAIKLDSNRAEYYHLLADVYMDYYKSKPALNTMEHAAEKFPERIPTLLKLGEFQMILLQHNESSKTINEILKLDPQNAEAYFLLGMNFKETKDSIRAINSFRKVVELDPDLVDAWVLLGQLFADRNDPIAEEYFNTSLKIDPQNTDLLFNRANYYYENDKLEKAKTDFLNITQVDKQNSSSFFNIGLIYLEQDSLSKANQFFDFAVKTNPVYVAAYYYRGVCSEIMGDKNAAIRDFKQVLNFDPDFKDTEVRLNKLTAQ